MPSAIADRPKTSGWLSNPGRFLAAAYAVGFVIVNFHLARYAEPRITLANASYLAAGLTYVFLAAIPAVSLILAHAYSDQGARKFQDKWPKQRWLRRSFVLLGTLIIQAVIYYLWHRLVDLIAVQHEHFGEITVFATSSLIGFVTFLNYTRIRDAFAAGDHSTRRLHDVFTNFLTGFTALVAAVCFYAAWMYPRIAPQFGGGAVPVVRVRLADSANADLRRVLARPVGLIDRTEGVAFFAICDRPNMEQPRRMAVPAQTIAFYEFVPHVPNETTTLRMYDLLPLGERACAAMTEWETVRSTGKTRGSQPMVSNDSTAHR